MNWICIETGYIFSVLYFSCLPKYDMYDRMYDRKEKKVGQREGKEGKGRRERREKEMKRESREIYKKMYFVRSIFNLYSVSHD